MINIAILGCGRIGQVHARSLGRMNSARVAAVNDALPEAADALAKAEEAEAALKSESKT